MVVVVVVVVVVVRVWVSLDCLTSNENKRQGMPRPENDWLSSAAKDVSSRDQLLRTATDWKTYRCNNARATTKRKLKY